MTDIKKRAENFLALHGTKCEHQYLRHIRDLLLELDKAEKTKADLYALISLILKDLKMRADEDGTLNLSDFIVIRIDKALLACREDKGNG